MMNRESFMKQLAALLSDLAEGEKNEALQYYQDYFEDAGSGMEAQIIHELGSPEKVAKIIKDGLNDTGELTSEYRDKKSKENQNDYVKQPISGSKIALLIILILLAIPVGIPLVLGAFSVVAVLLVVVVAVLILIVGVTAALLVSGVVVFSVGFVKLFSMPPVGILSCGIGLILTALGILLTLAIGLICAKLIPVCIKKIVKLLQLPFRRRGNFA